MEARGNALEKLQSENDALTDDYNGLRVRFAASEAEAAAKLTDLEARLAAAEAEAAAAPAAAPLHGDNSKPLVCCVSLVPLIISCEVGQLRLP